MKKTLITFLILTTSIGFSQDSEWTYLFDGETLNGWHEYNGGEVGDSWSVKNGELILSSKNDNLSRGNDIITDKKFTNFELSLEWNIVKGGNSGVFFRSTIDGTKISGWQVEVAPPNNHTGGIYESYGRGWLIKPDNEKDKYLKMGDWNKLTIKVYNDNVTTWLNGYEMISIDDEMIGKGEGRIALQIHDGGGIKVKWRNLTLTNLN